MANSPAHSAPAPSVQPARPAQPAPATARSQSQSQRNCLSAALTLTLAAVTAATVLLTPLGASAAAPVSASANANAATQQTGDAAAITEAGAQRNRSFEQQARALRGSAALHLKNGEAVPPFTLINEKGQIIDAPEAWAGKYVVLNFIFTRCLIPSMCPAATAQMTALQRKLEAQGLADKVQLVSITFDPAYDTPEVLADYAKLFGANAGNFDFLTGPEDISRAVLQRFAIITREQDGTINHTMTTTLLSPAGVIIDQAAGPVWSADNFIRQIRENIAAQEAAKRPVRQLPQRR